MRIFPQVERSPIAKPSLYFRLALQLGGGEFEFQNAARVFVREPIQAKVPVLWSKHGAAFKLARLRDAFAVVLVVAMCAHGVSVLNRHFNPLSEWVE